MTVRQRLVRHAVPVASASEGGQCDKVLTRLWVTIEDVAAARTSGTDSAKTVSIHLAEAMVFHLRATSEMIAVATALAAVTVMVEAVVIASAVAEIEAAAMAAGAVVLVAAVVEAVLTVCPLRSLALAKAR